MVTRLVHRFASGPFHWPDATNSGCSGPLLVVDTGDNRYQVQIDGTVLEDMEFMNGLIIQANDVVIRNCKVLHGGYYGIEADAASGLVVEYCTVIGDQWQGYNYAIAGGANCRIEHCDVSQHQHAIGVGVGTSVCRFNYIHNAFVGLPQWDRHVGGVSIKGGPGWVSTLVEHNNIYAQDTSAVFIKNDFGPVQNVIVRHNRMLTEPGQTGPGYCIQAGDSGPSGTVTGIQVLDNIMQRGGFGYIDVNGTTDVTICEGNVDWLTGASVDPV